MDRIRKYNWILNIQIAFAFVLSIFIANTLELINPITAGVITLLSIQMTRKQTLVQAIKRVVGFFIMLFVSVLIFSTLGHSLISFGLFVLIYALICSRLNLSIGLTPNVVMASHIYLENTIQISFLLNETYIYLLGVLVAIIVNLTIPYTVKRDKIDRLKLDNYIKNMLMYISNLLNEKYLIDDSRNDKEIYQLYIQKQITNINSFIENYEIDLLKNLENNLLKSEFYDIEYLYLRQRQFEILTRIYENTKRMDKKYLQTQKISEFIQDIHDQYDEDNTVKSLIDDANNMREYFEKEKLPSTRAEFENRAILFVILEDLTVFLREKYKFKK